MLRYGILILLSGMIGSSGQGQEPTKKAPSTFNAIDAGIQLGETSKSLSSAES